MTPFAQILASLRSVRNNYISLTNLPQTNRCEQREMGTKFRKSFHMEAPTRVFTLLEVPTNTFT